MTASPDTAQSQGSVRIVAANKAPWADLQSILTGQAARCQCTRQRLGDREWWHLPVEQRRSILREEVGCDRPDDGHTMGIVAYLDDEPVGWAAVDARASFARIKGSPVPWAGRSERKDDESVWAVACLVVRKGYRGRGLTYALVAGSVEHARVNGAHAIEGYPMLTHGREVMWDELNVGPVSAFAAAGFTEVSHPTVRRVVMRLDF